MYSVRSRPQQHQQQRQHRRTAAITNEPIYASAPGIDSVYNHVDDASAMPSKQSVVYASFNKVQAEAPSVVYVDVVDVYRHASDIFFFSLSLSLSLSLLGTSQFKRQQLNTVDWATTPTLPLATTFQPIYPWPSLIPLSPLSIKKKPLASRLATCDQTVSNLKKKAKRSYTISFSLPLFLRFPFVFHTNIVLYVDVFRLDIWLAVLVTVFELSNVPIAYRAAQTIAIHCQRDINVIAHIVHFQLFIVFAVDLMCFRCCSACFEALMFTTCYFSLVFAMIQGRLIKFLCFIMIV
jgi:hypothetical protein